MAEKTANYNLTKPLLSEFYDVEVQNGNMDIIDEALKENADAAAGLRTDLDSQGQEISGLQTGMTKKADLVDGKVPVDQLPQSGDYEPKGAVQTHNESPEAHPDIREALKKAQDTADEAIKVISEFAYTINAVPSQSGSLTYTGSPQSPQWNSFNPDTLEISGQTEETEAGTYTAIFTPKDKYSWSDGTEKTPKEVQWKINRASLPVPSQNGTLTYSGVAQHPNWNNYDVGKMTLGGDTEKTDAGTYQATFTLKDTNHQWADTTTGVKTVNWKIDKAPGTLSLDKQSLKLTAAKLSDTITANRAGNGVVSAKATTGGIVDITVQNNIVTVKAKAKGNTVVTVSVAEGTNHTAPESKTFTVDVSLPTNTLKDNDWATIKAVSDAGTGKNYWAVGDVKNIKIDGKVGDYTFSNLSVDVFILGFDHNSEKEGTHKIHFQIGKIGTTAVALCDSHYNNYDTTSTGWFKMNTTATNVGGWESCTMRTTLLGNSKTPTSPLANSLMAALPSDLRAVMKPVTKYTDNKGNGNNDASSVTSTTDYLFLLSEFEVFGSRSGANSAEQNFQKQYEYYVPGNYRVAYNHGSTASAVWWWLRSPYYYNSFYFRYVGSDGSYTNDYAYYSAGVRPGFAV